MCPFLMRRIAPIVTGARRDILQFAELVVNAHGFGKLHHVVIARPMIGRMFEFCAEERLDIM